MTRKLITINPEELIRKLLSGERDFSYVRTEHPIYLDNQESFKEVQEYLRVQKDHQKNPYSFSHSEFNYLHASGLYLPFLKANNARFYRCELNGLEAHNGKFNQSSVEGSTLEDSILDEITAVETKFKATSLRHASMKHAKSLSNADFQGADVYMLDLSFGNIKGIINFENSRNTEHIILFDTIISDAEKPMLDDILALKNKKAYIIEDHATY